MIEVEIGKCTGHHMWFRGRGLSSKEGLSNSIFVVWDYGLVVIYEGNNGCLGKRKSFIVGCCSVGLEAFL